MTAVKIIEPMTLALILGMLLASCTPLSKKLEPGIQFTTKTILEIGIILLGLKLNLHAIKSMPVIIPLSIICISSLIIISSLILGYICKLDSNLNLLLAVGNAICGSSAIVALASVIKAPHKKTVTAIAAINILGLCAVFIIPAIASQLRLSNLMAGFLAGSSVQAVAQATAAGYAYTPAAGLYATIIKLFRVLLLGPYILVINLIYHKKQPTNNYSILHNCIPKFVLLFILMVVLNTLSYSYFPPAIIYLHKISALSPMCLCMALAAIGLQANLKQIVIDGKSCLYVAGVIFAFMLAIYTGVILHII